MICRAGLQNITVTWAAFLVLFFCPPLLADEQQTEEQTQDEETALPCDEIGEIVVTARRMRQPSFEADRSLHSLSEEHMLRLQGQSLPDNLLETTGVYMQRTNRGAGAPFLRGLVGPQNLITIDGIRFNNSTFRTGPNQYLATIDPSALSRIEVMLGPGSVLYGSDAMGGVIQLFPLDWRKKSGPGLFGGYRFTSYDLASNLWADAQWQDEYVGLMAGGNFMDAGSLRGGDGTKQPISEYLRGSWHARGKYKIGDDMQIGVTYLGMRMRDAGREDRLYEGRFRFYDNDDDFVYLDFRYEPGGMLKQLRVAASYHSMREVIDRYRCDLPENPVEGDAAPCLDAARVGYGKTPREPLTRQEIYTDGVRTPGVMASVDLGFLDDRLRLAGGLEGYFDFVSSAKEQRRGEWEPAWQWHEEERGNFSDGSFYSSFGAFAHAEGDILRHDGHRLVASAGGRVSNFTARADDVPGLGDVDYSHTGLVGSLGVEYLYAARAMAYVNFSQGFRAPNLQETTVMGDTGSKFEVPNDDLSPERSNTLEIGTRLRWKPVRFFVCAFISFADKVIDERELDEDEWRELDLDPEAIGDKPVVQRVNSASGLFWGMEGTLTLGPWMDTVLWARLAWVRAEIETPAGEIYPARRIPPLMGAAGLRYERAERGFYVEIFTRFAGSQTRLHPSDESDLRICEDPDSLGNTYGDSGASCPGTEAWATLNLRAGYRLDKRLRVDVAATNLTDELYHYHGSGIDAPGAGISVSMIGSY